jgi:hypothetical protein
MSSNKILISTFSTILLFGCCDLDKEKNYSDGIVFEENFETNNIGKYTSKNIKNDFKNPTFLWGYFDRIKFYLGLTGNNLEIVKDESKCLKVKIPSNTFGPIPGLQWSSKLNEIFDELILSYSVKFNDNFDFVKGGKLPGLAGGTANTGGKIPNGYDGWSARMMFWENGKICCWLYHCKQLGKFGDSLFLKVGESYFNFQTNRWYEIKIHIKINSIDKSNGFIECSINNKPMLRRHGLIFTKTENLKIDQFIFSVFLGGDDSTYQSKKDEFILFDNIKIIKN